MVEQLLNIGGLNARLVARACLRPVPLAPTTWVELEVPACRQALDIHATPRNVSDAGRLFPFVAIGVHERPVGARAEAHERSDKE